MPAKVAWVIVAMPGQGRARADAIAKDPRCTLLAQVEPPHDAPFSLTSRWPAHAVALYDPVERRAVVVERALREGLHVCVPAPLSADPAEVAALFSLAAERGQVLHLAHDGLLEGPVRALRALTSWRDIHRVHAHLDLNGPMVMGAGLALESVSIIQRVLHIAGKISQIEDVRGGPGALDAELRLKQGASLTLHVRQAPDFSPWIRMEVEEGRHLWRIEGDSLYRDGSPQTLLMGPPAGAEDHQQVMEEILSGARPFVPHGAVLHALEVASKLGLGWTGVL